MTISGHPWSGYSFHQVSSDRKRTHQIRGQASARTLATIGGHPLFSAPNVIITPHVATRADVPRERMEAVVKENVRRYVAGEKMLSVVNPKLRY